MSERRFTDQEVALILQRASHLETKAEESHAGRGLALSDLQQIATEVGIAPSLLSQAIADTDASRGAAPAGILGPSGVAKAVRVVASKMPTEDVRSLVRTVDSLADVQGTVSEALGEVRWTGRSRFRGTQVAIAHEGEETVVRVEERLTQRARRVAHMVPGSVGAALGVSVAGAAGLAGAGFLGLAVAGVVSGFGIGRLVWRRLCAASHQRVKTLSDALAGEGAP